MEKLLIDRQIDWLMHFTNVVNLPNIFKYGLMPRSELLTKNIKSEINDLYRYDNCQNAICTSIEFPNYQMFYSLRKENEDINWAVLLLDAKVICDFDCAFCSSNAGSEAIYTIPLKERKGKRAFMKLFDELPDGPTRKQMGIKDWFPTNPQAEVLVFDNIPITYIEKVFFKDNKIMNEYIAKIPKEVESVVNKDVFSYRDDWAYWKKK
jgi:hypothetical protein